MLGNKTENTTNLPLTIRQENNGFTVSVDDKASMYKQLYVAQSFTELSKLLAVHFGYRCKDQLHSDY